jgi:hypothetical protein
MLRIPQDRQQNRSQLTLWQKLACHATPPPGYKQRCESDETWVRQYHADRTKQAKPVVAPEVPRNFEPSSRYDLPDGLWEKILTAHPRSALAMNSASVDLRASTQRAADRINAIAAPIRRRDTESHVAVLEGMKQEAQANVEAASFKKVLSPSLLPFVSEFKSARLRGADAVVLGTLHMALYPVVLPIRLKRRVERAQARNKHIVEYMRIAQGLDRAKTHPQLFLATSALSSLRRNNFIRDVVTVSRDGRWLAVLLERGDVLLWDLAAIKPSS